MSLDFDVLELLSELCDIYPPVEAVTDTGGRTITYPTASQTGIACALTRRVSPASAERQVADRLATVLEYKINVPPETTVTSKDRITVTSLSNRVFNVRRVENVSAEDVKTCVCDEVL